MLKHKFGFYLFAVLFAIMVSPSQGLAAPAAPKAKIIVAKSGGNYTTITAALNAITPSAGNPYVIEVWPGTYSENITMKSYVVLQGSGRDVTTIQGTSTINPTIDIRSLSQVTVAGFTVKGAADQGIVSQNSSFITIKDNKVVDLANGAGINNFGVTSVVISNNILENNGYGGIGCYSCTDVIITRNAVSGGGGGISVAYASSLIIEENKLARCISAQFADAVQIIGNHISTSSSCGILTYGSAGIIKDNTVTSGGYGINVNHEDFYNTGFVTISGNIVTVNSGPGLFLSSKTKVQHNQIGDTGTGTPTHVEIGAGSTNVSLNFNVYDRINGAPTGSAFNAKSDGTPWP